MHTKYYRMDVVYMYSDSFTVLVFLLKPLKLSNKVKSSDTRWRLMLNAAVYF